MIYITSSDLKLSIPDNRLHMILDNDMTLLDYAESIAMATVQDALYPYYDVNTIYSLSGNNRKAQVTNWIINIMIYHIYDRIPDKLVPDRVIKNYDDTMDILESIADGKRSVMLPVVEVDKDDDGDTEPATKFRWGSQERRIQDV